MRSICIGFTVATIALLAWGACFADDATKQGIYYCWSILAVCVAAPALQLVFFTPAVIRRMAYPARLALFGVCLCATLCAFAVFLGWFPVSDPRGVGYLLGCLSHHLGGAHPSAQCQAGRETRELDEGLAEYCKSRETQ